MKVFQPSWIMKTLEMRNELSHLGVNISQNNLEALLGCPSVYSPNRDAITSYNNAIEKLFDAVNDIDRLEQNSPTELGYLPSGLRVFIHPSQHSSFFDEPVLVVK